MQAILHEINMNIARKKIELVKKKLNNMSKDFDIMETKIDYINQVHYNLLYKKEPVGSSSNAIKYLKLQR